MRQSDNTKETFASGAQRDTQDGKLRYELIPPGPLAALAKIYTDGAAKYGENNYQKGMPFMRVAASLLRHYYAWVAGDRSERHMANLAWNAFALLFYEDQVEKGALPQELDDRPVSPVVEMLRTDEVKKESRDFVAEWLDSHLKSSDYPKNDLSVYYWGDYFGYSKKLVNEAAFRLGVMTRRLYRDEEGIRYDWSSYPEKRAVP